MGQSALRDRKIPFGSWECIDDKDKAFLGDYRKGIGLIFPNLDVEIGLSRGPVR